jgi:soluble lytic murein transglycosylase-like protein
VSEDIHNPPSIVAYALGKAAGITGIEEPLLRAVAWTESRFHTNAVSSAGAMGLMQLMPATAKSVGVTDPFDPTQNALGGARILQARFKKFGNWSLALGAYNWGQSNVSEHPYPQSWPEETQAFWHRVFEAYASLQTTGTAPAPPTPSPLVAELLHKLARPYPWARRSV